MWLATNPPNWPIVLKMPRPAATALPQRNVPGILGQWAENSSCRSLGSSEEAGKPIAIVERAHAKPPVKCAASAGRLQSRISTAICLRRSPPCSNALQAASNRSNPSFWRVCAPPWRCRPVGVPQTYSDPVCQTFDVQFLAYMFANPRMQGRKFRVGGCLQR